MPVPQWIIETKRDGGALTREEIESFIQGYHREEIPDYQMAAMAMAIYLKGMTPDETGWLTRAMMNTGQTLDTSTLDGPVCDKHSTGGIGDKVSLILGPLAAACGIDVPMISGRGLGITGGTLDKLETIPGYRTDLTEDEMIQVVRKVGCCIVGQTDRLAPADKKLYALRDVTGTVPSIPLITASIMCKKLSEGLEALVLDVKAGSGAFMKTVEDARALAKSLVDVGASMQTPVAARITRMDAPLGRCVGNALEVQESIDMLKGAAEGPLWEVTRELTAAMCVITGVDSSSVEALKRVDEALSSGEALEVFRRMVTAQDGEPEVVDRPEELLPAADHKEDVKADHPGTVTGVNAEKVGRAVLVLGGGRRKSDDIIQPGVGLSNLVGVGETVESGQPLYTLHFNEGDRAEEARHLLADAITLGDQAPDVQPVILERIDPS